MFEREKVYAIQEIISAVGTKINLPRVVVLGSQSSGKSSVLEQILRRDVLPRGHNLVTRCPIIISLKNSQEEKAFIDGQPCDPGVLSGALKDRMMRICGNKKGIVDRPLHLELFTPDTIDVVLIDLPGLTKIPLGEQPSDIEEQVLRMVKRYISSENALILCIIAANADIATCESLKIAKEVDPGYKRTIGVLTKIDIMDDGTDCGDILDNSFIRLEHGFVGVVNRSQLDISQGTSIERAILREEEWFSSHPVYSRYGNRIGSKYLNKQIGCIFSSIIDREIPNICVDVRERIQSLKKKCQELGRELTVEELVKEYRVALGKFIGSGGETRIRHANCNFLKAWMVAVLNLRVSFPFDQLKRTVSATENSILVPEKALERAIRECSAVVSGKILHVCENGFRELLTAIKSCSHKDYTCALDHLNSMVLDMLTEQNEVFKTEIERLHRISISSINLNHPKYNMRNILSKKIVEKVLGTDRHLLCQPDYNIFTQDFLLELMVALVNGYMSISVSEMKQDTLKLINHMFGEFIKEDVFSALRKVGREINLGPGDPDVRRKRKECEDEILRLEKSLQVLTTPLINRQCR